MTMHIKTKLNSKHADSLSKIVRHLANGRISATVQVLMQMSQLLRDKRDGAIVESLIKGDSMDRERLATALMDAVCAVPLGRERMGYAFGFPITLQIESTQEGDLPIPGALRNSVEISANMAESLGYSMRICPELFPIAALDAPSDMFHVVFNIAHDADPLLSHWTGDGFTSVLIAGESRVMSRMVIGLIYVDTSLGQSPEDILTDVSSGLLSPLLDNYTRELEGIGCKVSATYPRQATQLPKAVESMAQQHAVACLQSWMAEGQLAEAIAITVDSSAPWILRIYCKSDLGDPMEFECPSLHTPVKDTLATLQRSLPNLKYYESEVDCRIHVRLNRRVNIPTE